MYIIRNSPLIEQSQTILEIDAGVIEKAILNLAAEYKITIDEKPYLDHKAVYLSHFHLAENQAAARLTSLINASQKIRKMDIDKAIPWVQEKLSITLAEKQFEAVKSAVEHKVMIITGGPGTGKTTIINAVLKIFAAVKAKILLAAPTGRAAKRMTESTGHEAKTIHRLLEFNMKKGGFQKNDETPLDCDILIIDEASMIDIILMHHLLKAVPISATLILVGDVNQ